MRASRALAILLYVYGALIVLASLAALLPWQLPLPEVGLLVALHVGLSARGSAPANAAVGLGVGYLSDLFAGSPLGLHALTLAVVVLLARAASRRLLVRSGIQLMVVAFLATLLEAELLLTLSSGASLQGLSTALRIAPKVALITALLAPVLVAGLRRIDRRLAPEPGRLRLAF